MFGRFGRKHTPPPKATYVSFVLYHCFRAGGLDFEYDLVWHRIVQEKLATPPDKVALRRYMPLKAPPPAALAGYAFQIGSPVGLRPAGEPHLMSSMLVSNREPWVRKPNTVGVRSQSRWFQTQNRRLTNQTQSRRFSNEGGPTSGGLLLALATREEVGGGCRRVGRVG